MAPNDILLGNINPALSEKVARLMRGYPRTWCICGGWALSLHAGRLLRDHGDIEVAVFRQDQLDLGEFLLGWNPKWVNPKVEGTLVSWQVGESLQLPIHEIHTLPPHAGIEGLEFLLNESAGSDWVYRRNPNITMPLSKAIINNDDAAPYLAPEIVLLYKSKHCRQKDGFDFDQVLPLLTEEQCDWLINSLKITDSNHHWIGKLLGVQQG